MSFFGILDLRLFGGHLKSSALSAGRRQLGEFEYTPLLGAIGADNEPATK
jgi:hypothetical protein